MTTPSATQIVEELKKRYPPPWFEKHTVHCECGRWGAFFWIHGLVDEYYKIQGGESPESLLAAIRQLPVPGEERLREDLREWKQSLEEMLKDDNSWSGHPLGSHATGVRAERQATADILGKLLEPPAPPLPAPAAEEAKPEHRCGVEGFDGMKGDICPACDYAAGERLKQITPPNSELLRMIQYSNPHPEIPSDPFTSPAPPSPAPAAEEAKADCMCRRCADARPNPNHPTLPWSGTRFVVCETCGNKRCPHAEWHGFKCSGSNAPHQSGVPIGTSTADVLRAIGVNVAEPASPAPSAGGDGDAQWIAAIEYKRRQVEHYRNETLKAREEVARLQGEVERLREDDALRGPVAVSEGLPRTDWPVLGWTGREWRRTWFWGGGRRWVDGECQLRGVPFPTLTPTPTHWMHVPRSPADYAAWKAEHGKEREADHD